MRRPTNLRTVPALRSATGISVDNHVTASHLSTAGTANVTVTDSTAKTLVTQLVVPANQFAPGTTFEWDVYSTYTTTSSPPTMQWEADWNSTAVNVTITPHASTSGGFVEFRGAASCLTDGTAGTANASATLWDASSSAIAGAHNLAFALDTTSAGTLSLYVKMTTAVASNSISVYNAYIHQIN